MLLQEAFGPGGNGSGNYTSVGNFPSWAPTAIRYSPHPRAKDVSSPAKLDKEIEQQLIDRGIDILLSDYPQLVQSKRVRLHHINMLIGRITSGEVNDIISLKNFIKRLKKKTGIKVEHRNLAELKLRDMIDAAMSSDVINARDEEEYGRAWKQALKKTQTDNEGDVNERRFREQLKKFGVRSVKDLSKEDKKKFFSGLLNKAQTQK